MARTLLSQIFCLCVLQLFGASTVYAKIYLECKGSQYFSKLYIADEWKKTLIEDGSDNKIEISKWNETLIVGDQFKKSDAGFRYRTSRVKISRISGKYFYERLPKPVEKLCKLKHGKAAWWCNDAISMDTKDAKYYSISGRCEKVEKLF